MQICQRCVLPETFPGIDFDDAGICRLCREAPDAAEMLSRRAGLREQMEAAIAAAQGQGSYDCLVAFSGGKDSSYTLKLLVEKFGLRCLAITIDNGFISPQAVKNCRKVTSALGVDFSLFTPAPDFMNAMYRISAESTDVHAKAAITRASSMCNSCINLINAHMMRASLEKGIPLIAGGYIGGQVPKDAAVIQVDFTANSKSRAISLRRYIAHFGEDSTRYFGISDELIERSAVKKLTIVNPMLTEPVSEEEIIADISQLGWKPTADTGKNSSNCRLNDLGILVHYQKHGFNPYVGEIAEQVRAGLMDRAAGLKKAAAIPEPSQVAGQAKTVGIELEDLRKSA